MQTLYSTEAIVTGGRTGNASLKDSHLKIHMVAPGSDKEGNNPEQLFAMGYAACFDGALAAVKQVEKAKFDSTTHVSVDLLKGEGLDFQLAVKIHVVAENTALTADEFQALVEKANKVCPYSKATNGNIDSAVTSEVK
ncbi:Ohr family peroxiredoxin [Psychrobacter urativorans]|uniref:Osmotically inducible protein OsmC n=1 Tax=Psychrobacter urativorans TaxID=45610 RepID=A0A0M5TIT5_9GAMM|nr:Ohr family peroxiredoxin [Psychrobacter urativorans]ALF60075.1 osmotically inducible protein OsmC [Psychrobacter urativorans]